MTSRGEVRSLIREVRKMREQLTKRQPAEPLRFVINEGMASARLQAAGILWDEAGNITFTLRIGHEDEGSPTLLKPDV
jgi:hypothetical protein